MLDTIFNNFDTPPAAKLLGWHLLDLDPKEGTIKVRFDAKTEFTNPGGHIQGGILTAMLDDTMGPAIVGMTNGKLFGRTINLHTHFLRPVSVGLVTATGRVTKLGKTTAFVEAELFDKDGKLSARAVASFSLSPIQSVLPA